LEGEGGSTEKYSLKHVNKAFKAIVPTSAEKPFSGPSVVVMFADRLYRSTANEWGNRLQTEEVLLLENIRFIGEEKGVEAFAKMVSELGTVYVK
jgi:3-phosphoglycerate kinase